MTPFQIRRERFSEFCLMLRRLYLHDQKQEKTPKQNTDGKEKNFVKVTDYKPISKGVGVNG